MNEWLRFLKQIDEQTPADRELHLIVDNYATHKHARGKAGSPNILASTCTLPRQAPRG